MDSRAQSDATTADPPRAEPQVVFRGKKRKFYRKREVEDVENGDQDTNTTETTEASATRPAVATPSEDTDEEGIAVAEVLRRRNARKARLRGVGFGNEKKSNAEDELSLMIREEQEKVLDVGTQGGMTKRFAAQTGLVGELVSKHMTEYIEAQLAKRHSSAPGDAPGPDASSNGAKTTAQVNEHELKNNTEGHPIMQGKLMEIDLGEEARSRNETMTERARRKLQGESVEDEEQAARPKKVRLGRDGKPWRSRNRRNSDAIKRDQLVEEILRESRLDVYDAPAAANASAINDDDGAADDRIAEEFRREFLDAMAQRQQKKKPVAPPAKPGAKKEEEVLKGPKLGGSRNARAAMRDMLLKKEREGKR
ncbi:uncharacterized protein BCR38DRAFT_483683 [Pseudomassariella vexata]|uniref:Hepatocellular carcinoma-associated antigen 59-domain-containing protein n=1 Tax=Pseudomassariella vexata TaxID=1141098 RepID=A0A1Y2E3B3_9PEZI|nr:uncharacterized protein BCR38DRAFT_483683 [Pseudomassariella vexata]ORY66022.1 hypothetical protein BCR38DRAFT_483683 [Pseudomassariella vexata]